MQLQKCKRQNSKLTHKWMLTLADISHELLVIQFQKENPLVCWSGEVCVLFLTNSTFQQGYLYYIHRELWPSLQVHTALQRFSLSTGFQPQVAVSSTKLFTTSSLANSSLWPAGENLAAKEPDIVFKSWWRPNQSWKTSEYYITFIYNNKKKEITDHDG